MEERIYIGGLYPPRLTAEDVAVRLEGIDGVEIRSTDLVGNDKKFFYVNAVSNDDNMSALDKIAKQYNNVTWKRCRLVVQAARPHFLERLEQERLQRETDRKEEEETLQELKESRKIPRHLRIRQKYGEEAHQVDTKPCRTDEWTDFCRVVNKLRTKREQYSIISNMKHEQQNEAAMAKKKAFRNRAVHLRWKDNMNNGNSSTEPSLVDAVMSDALSNDDESSQGTSSSSDSDRHISANSDPRPLENGIHSAYVWSDDESDDSSRSEDGSVRVSEENVSSESESEEEVAAVSVQDGAPVEQGSAQYAWSSDDSDDEADNAAPPQQNASFVKPESSKETAEFSAAIDFSGSSSDNDNDDRDSGDLSEKNNIPGDAQNLDKDVKTNLGVLASLFPDMAETKPVSVDTGGDSNEEQDKGRSKTMQPGWEMVAGSSSMSTNLGLMQRFDPTKESAKKYIIGPSMASTEDAMASGTSDQSSNTSDEMDRDEHSDSDKSSSDEPEDAAEAVAPEERDAKTAIYEQSKLEDIFRQARSSGGNESFKMSSMFESKVPESGQEESGKPFAFGFDVGSDTAATTQSAQQSSAFSFSFDVGAKDPQGSHGGGELETSATKTFDDGADREEKEQTDQVSAGIQRRGLHFSDDTLDEYTDAFFFMNEGSRIRQDPQGFLRDEGVKQEWKKERHALTLDWKRKRKYAQARMQKKMKFR